MHEALRWGCLLLACLAAAARVAAPVVVAGAATGVVKKVEDEGQCEVLDLSKESLSPDFLLPATLTVKPSAALWRLDVTLGQGKEAAVCVRLEDKQARLRVTATMRHCEEGDVTDYNYLNVSVLPGAWTSLRVDAAGNAVTVSAPDGTSTSVGTHGSPLPHDGQQVALTGARDVEVAVGCHTSCPGYRHASQGNDKKVTVKQWAGDSVHFYFRPGEDFVKLEYEVTCTTPLGHNTFPHVADIKLDQKMSQNLWHLVDLQHHSGLITVRLDHRLLKNTTLTSGCTFTQHTIRVMGDSFFSFICNPFTGHVERREKADSSLTNAGVNSLIIANTVWAIVVVVLLGVILYLWLNLRQLKTNIKKDNTNKGSNKNKTNKSSNNNNNDNIQDHNQENQSTIRNQNMTMIGRFFNRLKKTPATIQDNQNMNRQ